MMVYQIIFTFGNLGIDSFCRYYPISWTCCKNYQRAVLARSVCPAYSLLTGHCFTLTSFQDRSANCFIFLCFFTLYFVPFCEKPKLIFIVMSVCSPRKNYMEGTVSAKQGDRCYDVDRVIHNIISNYLAIGTVATETW